MTMCSGSEEASDCALDAHCRVKPHMGVVSNAVRGALAAVSLEALALPDALTLSLSKGASSHAGERSRFDGLDVSALENARGS
jgi:hypothetical protein